MLLFPIWEWFSGEECGDIIILSPPFYQPILSTFIIRLLVQVDRCSITVEKLAGTGDTGQTSVIFSSLPRRMSLLLFLFCHRCQDW